MCRHLCCQITIPYLDPALPYQTRQDALRANYGFICGCRLCTFQASIEPVPAPPRRTTSPENASASSRTPDTDPALARLDATLRTFSFGDMSHEPVRVLTAPCAFERLPSTLHQVLHESYLPALSEAFSKTAHEGPYGDAVDTGLTLLAFYVAVYPSNYPQIGELPLHFFRN